MGLYRAFTPCGSGQCNSSATNGNWANHWYVLEELNSANGRDVTKRAIKDVNSIVSVRNCEI